MIKFPTHFITAYYGKGLDHMNFFLDGSEIKKIGLEPGDELGIFNGEICVGAATIDNPNQEYLSIVASSDDPTTTAVDGFVENHLFLINIWKCKTNKELGTDIFTAKDGTLKTFTKGGTSVLVAKFDILPRYYLMNAYPNPSHFETNFVFSLTSKNRLRLEIIDNVGKLVKVIIDNELEAGEYKITWDNRLSNGFKADPVFIFIV